MHKKKYKKVPTSRNSINKYRNIFNRPLTVIKLLKRKTNSAGLRLIDKLEKICYGLPKNFCLITGAPRSGTTAIEKWLNNQNKVTAFHESRVLRTTHRFIEESKRHSKLNPDGEFANLGRTLVYKYYNKRCYLKDYDVLIDKEPLMQIGFPDKDYSLFLQNYRVIFPNGKLLFMLREPLSTIWSMQQRKWGYSRRNYEPRSFSLNYYIKTWLDCADLILDYADDENTYVCYFERLVDNPVKESENIFNFLQIPGGSLFQPREVKTVGFSDDERELIYKKTKSHVDALTNKGLLYKHS